MSEELQKEGIFSIDDFGASAKELYNILTQNGMTNEKDIMNTIVQIGNVQTEKISSLEQNLKEMQEQLTNTNQTAEKFKEFYDNRISERLKSFTGECVSNIKADINNSINTLKEYKGAVEDKSKEIVSGIKEKGSQALSKMVDFNAGIIKKSINAMMDSTKNEISKTNKKIEMLDTFTNRISEAKKNLSLRNFGRALLGKEPIIKEENHFITGFLRKHLEKNLQTQQDALAKYENKVVKLEATCEKIKSFDYSNVKLKVEQVISNVSEKVKEAFENAKNSLKESQKVSEKHVKQVGLSREKIIGADNEGVFIFDSASNGALKINFNDISLDNCTINIKATEDVKYDVFKYDIEKGIVESDKLCEISGTEAFDKLNIDSSSKDSMDKSNNRTATESKDLSSKIAKR